MDAIAKSGTWVRQGGAPAVIRRSCMRSAFLSG